MSLFLLIDVNYWNNYKHLFVRKIDNKSYDSINKFYQYVTSMQEQQELLRNLQRNYFYVKQNAICNVEISFIIETLKEVDCSSVSSNQLQSFFQEVSTASAEKQSEILTYEQILDALLEISGIEGYRTLCKIAKMINK